MSGAPSADEIETSVLSVEECLELLERRRVGRLAVVIGEGVPVIRPVNYAFDRPTRSVVIRTAAGSKLVGLLVSARAAFEIDEVDVDARCGWSVIVTGVCREETSPATIERLERLGLEPWAPGDKPHWITLHAGSVSGRRIAPDPAAAAVRRSGAD
jgi:nitroimidazol reductase NimA-like FMN-containing flavoprotein (pyridoxamine 5'-phosphate oxidase superfamily)